MKYYYLINGKIMSENEKMPVIKHEYYDFESDMFNWLNSLQPCEISESELCLILSNVSKLDYDNPIEVTDIVNASVICKVERCDGECIECNHMAIRIAFKHPKQVEEIEAVELKYTTQEMIDAVNYGFKYAHESQNHTGDVPLGNILQWIMYKRNLLDVPKEFEDLKNSRK